MAGGVEALLMHDRDFSIFPQLSTCDMLLAR